MVVEAFETIPIGQKPADMKLMVEWSAPFHSPTTVKFTLPNGSNVYDMVKMHGVIIDKKNWPITTRKVQLSTIGLYKELCGRLVYGGSIPAYKVNKSMLVLRIIAVIPLRHDTKMRITKNQY